MEKEEIIAQRLREAVDNANVSLRELSRITRIPNSALQRYITGETKKIPIDRLERLAETLGVNTAYLFGWIEQKDKAFRPIKKHGVRIPVLGRIVAGVPVEAIEDVVDYEEIEPELASTGNFFGLVVNGDSMAPRILNGDVVIVKQQSDAESGKVVVAMVNGQDATVKQLKKEQKGIALVPYNPAFNVLRYSCDEVRDLPVNIIGVVVELRGKFQ